LSSDLILFALKMTNTYKWNWFKIQWSKDSNHFTNVLTIIILRNLVFLLFSFNGVHADYHQNQILPIKLNMMR
jgi:hypothetical protein